VRVLRGARQLEQQRLRGCDGNVLGLAQVLHRHGAIERSNETTANSRDQHTIHAAKGRASSVCMAVVRQNSPLARGSVRHNVNFEAMLHQVQHRLVQAHVCLNSAYDYLQSWFCQSNAHKGSARSKLQTWLRPDSFRAAATSGVIIENCFFSKSFVPG
jgi:hypothetical protein